MTQLEQEARRAYQGVRGSPWLGRLTRVGFLCKGVVYVLLGGLAILAALRQGGETTDTKGIIRRLANEPFGEVILFAVVFGLAAYSLWRFIAAFSDTERHGSSLPGLGARAGHFASGAAYSLIVIYAARLLLNGSAPRDAEVTRTWTAALLQAPGGFLLVALAGLIVIGAGGWQVWVGICGRFTEFLQEERLPPRDRRWLIRAGKAGYISRGVVLAIVGVFLILAALKADPSQAQGLEGVLDTLARQRYGQWMLAAIAAGLTCFGFYTMVEARFRRIPQ